MTSEEFHTWSQRLQFASETEALIAAIRSSPPGRRVSGRANNVTGRYPSPKMHCSIQFEGEHVEFWAIYGMERDDDVLEFYDQPSLDRLVRLAISIVSLSPPYCEGMELDETTP